jgi:DNA-binding beta-propeller fold protein YncE
MKTSFYVIITWWFLSCQAQDNFGTEHLQLERVIEMPGVKGRIDHMAVNVKDKMLYMAALGNNTVEVIDLQKGAVVHSITGIEEPQGIAYLPEQNEIAVASGGNGDCLFYNAADYSLIATLHLNGDADNVRYDSVTRKIYVGYGNGAIAVIDAATHKQIGDVPLPAHPESFQLDKKHNILLVNVPHANSICLIDLNELKVIKTWKIDTLRDNFPMALDTAQNRVFIGYRKPAVAVAYDVVTAKEIGRNKIVDDTDDVFYYEAKKQLMISGGGGFINILKDSANTFKPIASIFTRSGARTSLLIRPLKTYVVAERADMGKHAAVAVYSIRDINNN